MSNYLIGYFSRRQVFHIVAYRDSQEEVDAFLKTHNKRGLVVYASQHSAHPTKGILAASQALSTPEVLSNQQAESTPAPIR